MKCKYHKDCEKEVDKARRKLDDAYVNFVVLFEHKIHEDQKVVDELLEMSVKKLDIE